MTDQQVSVPQAPRSGVRSLLSTNISGCSSKHWLTESASSVCRTYSTSATRGEVHGGIVASMLDITPSQALRSTIDAVEGEVIDEQGHAVSRATATCRILRPR